MAKSSRRTTPPPSPTKAKSALTLKDVLQTVKRFATQQAFKKAWILSTSAPMVTQSSPLTVATTKSKTRKQRAAPAVELAMTDIIAVCPDGLPSKRWGEVQIFSKKIKNQCGRKHSDSALKRALSKIRN